MDIESNHPQVSTQVCKPARDCFVASGGRGLELDLREDGLGQADADSAVGTASVVGSLKWGRCHEMS